MVQLRTDVDLNLLTALDRLLETRSVTQAAMELHLSVPAMSHTLARIRVTFDDAILVRSGRQLVPTPRAEELRAQVRSIVDQTQQLLSRPGPFNPIALSRTMAIRTNDSLVGSVGPRLAEIISRSAPLVTLRFVPEGDRHDIESLRKDDIDLSITAALPPTPDIEQTTLFKDHFVAIVREDHPILTGRLNAKRFANQQHVVTSRHGNVRGPVDEQLETHGLERRVSLIVPTFYAAVFAASASDLVATVPGRVAAEVCKSMPMRSFKVPLNLPNYAVVSAWHRRLSNDPAHQWLRNSVEAALG